MATDSLVVVSWDAPPWAHLSITDESAVIHSLVLGRTAGDRAGVDDSVELVQRDELSTDANTVSIIRRPPFLRVAGAMIVPQDIHALARMLHTADELVCRLDAAFGIGAPRRG